MSKIALTGNALGSGTLTLAAPNTNTDRTLTLPDSAGTMMLTDTGVTTAQMPAGSVIQVVENNQTLARASTSSTSFVDTGFFVNITPTSASSKIVINFNCTGMISGGNYASYTIYRDSTDLSDWTNQGFVYAGYNTVGGIWFPVSVTRIDSPASTSQLTYKVYIKSGDAALIAYAGRNGATGTKNQVQLIAMEIAG